MFAGVLAMPLVCDRNSDKFYQQLYSSEQVNSFSQISSLLDYIHLKSVYPKCWRKVLHSHKRLR